MKPKSAEVESIPMSATMDETLITRSDEPLNLEMPFASLREFITPNESFYVRCHFPVPQISAEMWQLKLEGAVAKSIALKYDDLRRLPQQTLTATMECAGNGRSLLEPKVKGVAWEIGAVGNAEWRGVWLRDVLEFGRIDADATEVILEGADRGTIKEPPRPPGEINYARSLPLAKANDDVLLAMEMNGEPLSAAHGFPLRAIVPGWFGMASVKWLQRIVVSAVPFQGYYQSIDYAYWARGEGNLPQLQPLREMQVKAQIARPAPGEVLRPNESYRVHGAAWSAGDEVAAVEFSDDAGESWTRVDLLGQPIRYAWRFWEWQWTTPARPGRYTLMARATDSAGRVQPRERIPDYGTYMVNHWLPIRVEVR